ncbi:hypothetical protein JYK14_22465 [Siccirubricoccus sp. KC 17139]|uniref:Twin-arginine translocation signal domain-containing protein n=1 Tax=Siccirubricoccus soli TaxID=2899147 RepID=A0ABT1DCG6_9PROT|nr:hypothetical protein [Siccirubricoccus soli]MCO6418900.1 hypothetical protein [Siccirubricoccus soli]MCP2685035.1 hypothetical protein [Siccirubricoccus soli]
MHRRELLRGAAAAGAVGVLPQSAIAPPAANRALKFIPQPDPGILDPVVATDLAAQQAAREMQALAVEEVPTLPLGRYSQSIAYRRTLSEVAKGMPVFWNLKKG